MLQIKLFCALGMSTGILVKNMEKAAKSQGIEVDIKACNEGKLSDYCGEMDVALLGPQVSYTFKKNEVICNSHNIPIMVIPMVDYAMLDGEKVLKTALDKISEYKK
ncbi:PTS sugar transporter subunit IIB [Dolosigranulum pigrum]|uniref:PTS sugar transporter subunit IIB n=1 Tax=Dolosigranulum pigrum TaxID=29394 RepID=UPI000DBFC518|nr:PTS sugar transporter subunit IIB [Dolosigranulum pigrum]RAN57700.1 PTS sugar transporter subunit IIB [Dolosigranulum pigrum]RAN63755.1 PTS sugar transporter subunit IIB [Dolosigranulum pigrum]